MTGSLLTTSLQFTAEQEILKSVNDVVMTKIRRF